MVGETEETLKKKGVDYVVGRGPYANSVRGRIIGDTCGFLKLLFRRSDLKLLGVHVMGEHATELVHVGLMAMLTGEFYKETTVPLIHARELPQAAMDQLTIRSHAPCSVENAFLARSYGLL